MWVKITHLAKVVLLYFFFFFEERERNRERERGRVGKGQREREKENFEQCSMEPNVGINLTIVRS